jgi:hypothetical protein
MAKGMRAQNGRWITGWAGEKLTHVVMVLLVVFAGTSVLEIILTFNDYLYFDWFRVWVVILVAVSLASHFFGRMNIGFLFTILATIFEFFYFAILRSSRYEMDWGFIFSGNMTMAAWFFVALNSWFFIASAVLLPLISILLLVSRAKRRHSYRSA